MQALDRGGATEDTRIDYATAAVLPDRRPFARHPQAAFLVGCVRWALSDDADSSTLPATVGVDWTALLEAADAHAVLPLVAPVLEKIGPDAVPASTLALVREHLRSNELRNRILVAELVRVLDALEGRGVQAIPYKGPVLAVLAYGEVGRRQFTDLDLLVAVGDLGATCATLESLGYRRVAPAGLTPRQECHHISWDSEVELAGEDGFVSIDLHWRLAPRRLPFRVETAELFSRAGQAPFEGRRPTTLAAEDLLLVLCVHGTKDRWRKLGWISDVDRCLVAHPGLDWAAVLARAPAAGADRALRLGLRLASSVLGTRLPADVARRLESDARTHALAARVEDGFLSPRRRAAWVEASRIEPLVLACADRPGDRARYVAAALFVPDADDFAWTWLPDPMFPLYYVLRPLRLLARWLRLVLRGGDAGATALVADSAARADSTH